jgi:hypothetical protein
MRLLRSRKFVLAVVALAVQALATAIPETRPYAAELGAVVFAVVSVVVFGITVEDSVRLWATCPADMHTAIMEAVQEALTQYVPNTPAEG